MVFTLLINSVDFLNQDNLSFEENSLNKDEKTLNFEILRINKIH